MTTVGSLVVRMAADVAPLTSGLAQAGRNVDDFAQRLRMVEELMKRLAARTLAAGASMKALGDGMGNAGRTIEVQWRDLGSVIAGFPPAANAAANASRNLGAQMQYMGQSSLWAARPVSTLPPLLQGLSRQMMFVGRAGASTGASFSALGATAGALAGGGGFGGLIPPIRTLGGTGGFGGIPPAANAAAAAMNNASNSASRTSGFLRQAAAAAVGFGITVAAFRTINTIFASISAAIGTITDAVFSMNSALEQAQIAFSSMTGSAGMARNMLEQLKEFALRTPFEFKDAVTGAQRLLAMGFAAQEVIPMLTALGNTAAALGMGNEVIQRLVLALGQMKTAGRVLGQELRQLYNANVNINEVFEVMAQQTGKTVEELQKMQREGMLSADLFIDAFQEWSDVRFGDMMEQQSQTFAGAWVRVKDTLRIVAADAFQPIFDIVRDILVEFSRFTQSDQFLAWADSIRVKMDELSLSMRRFWEDLEPSVKRGLDSLGDLIVVAGNLSGALAPLKDFVAVIEFTIRFTSGSLEVLALVGTLFDKNTTQGKAFTESLEGVQRAISPGLAVIEVANEGLKELEGAQYENTEAAKAQVSQWEEATAAYRRGETALGDLITRQWGGFEATTAYTDAIAEGNESYIFQQQAIDRTREAMERQVSAVETGLSRVGSWTDATYVAAEAQNNSAKSTMLADEAFRGQLGSLLLLHGGYGSLDAMLTEVNEGRETELLTLQDLYDIQLLEQNVIHEIGKAAGDAAVHMAELRRNQAEVTEETGAYVREGHRGVQMARDLGVAVNEVADALQQIDFGPLIKDMEGLAGGFQVSVGMMEIFKDQSNQFDDINEQLKGAYDELNDRREAGLELSAEEIRFLDLYPKRSERMVGAMGDAAIQAGMWAGAAVDLMIAQDNLNEAIKNNEEDLTPYRDAVSDAETSLRDAATASGGFLSVNQVLGDVLLTQLVPVLQDIEEILLRLDETEASPSVTLNELVSSGSGGMGFTEFDGGPAYSGVTATVGGMIGAMNTLDQTTASPTVTLNDYASRPLGDIADSITWLQTNGSFTISAYLDTSNFDAGVAHIAANTPHSPAKEGPLAFTPNWDWLFEGLEAAAGKYTEEALNHLKNYVDTAKAIFDVFDQQIDFSLKFAEFQMSSGQMPDAEMLRPLKDFAEQLLQMVGESAALFSEEFLKATKEYADAAKAGIDLIASALEIVAGLQDMEHNLDKALHAASDLKFITEAIVLFIGDSAAMIERGEGIDHPSVRGEGFTGAAAAYAEGAQKAVELIGAAIDALEGLADFTMNMEAAMKAASDLKFLIEHIVLSIGDSAEIVNSDVDHPSARGKGFIGMAAEYAEGAEKAVGLIGDALGFITALADYEGQFDLAATMDFASDLKFLIEHIAISIADSAAYWDSDVNPSVEAFAEAAGYGLEIIGDAVEMLEIFQGEMDLSMLTVENVQDVARGLGGLARIVAEVFREVSADWSEEVNPAADQLAEDIGTSLGAITDIFDFLQKLRPDTDSDGNPIPIITSVEGLRDIARQLAEAARIVAEEFYEVAAGWDSTKNEAILEAQEAIEASIGIIRDILGLIKELNDMAGGGKERPLALGLDAVIQKILEFGVVLSEQVAPISEATTDIRSSMNTMKLESVLAVSDMVEETTELLEGWASSAVELGENYIESLVRGLRNKEGFLYQVIAQIIAQAIAAAKAAAGIASPSKPMVSMGENMVNSLADALMDDQPVQDAMGRMIGGLTSQLDGFKIYYDSAMDEIGLRSMGEDGSLRRYEIFELPDAEIPGLSGTISGSQLPEGAGAQGPINVYAKIDGRDVAVAIEPRMLSGMPTGAVHSG